MTNLRNYPWHIARTKKTVSPLNTIVLASRVSISRNLKDKAFVQNMTMEDLRGQHDLFQEGVFSNPKIPLNLFAMNEISANERMCLFERGLLPRLFLKTWDARYLAVSRDESFSIVLNGTEHIRWNKYLEGSSLEKCYDFLEENLKNITESDVFAYHPAHGFLCADPTLTGTGLRASVLLHLPALALSRETQFLHNAATAMDLEVTSLSGDKKLFPGNFYILSNHAALGLNERELLRKVESCAQKIAEREIALREKMMTEENILLRDFCSRSEAVLCSAYLLSTQEAMNAISGLMLAQDLGLPRRKKRLPDLKDLLLAIRSAHVEEWNQKDFSDPAERSEARARLVREMLNI